MFIKQNKLILIRHGQAAWATGDLQRSLTLVGEYQAQSGAEYLRTQISSDYLVYASQALRSQQTALQYCADIRIDAAFNPDVRLDVVLNKLQMIEYPEIILVGHLPWISGLINFLLGQQSRRLEMHTGEIYGITRTEKGWQVTTHFQP